ncbi:MAG: hypothetical protein N2651_01490, partial [Fimbriimonadales bacterium]|nr:hypothetical protein [Fimbriimonadales bacterium]
MSLLLFFSVTHNDSDNQYNFNRLETQVDFLRALPFDGRTMVRSFALSGGLGAALLSLIVYLTALMLVPSQWMVLLSAFVFTNLCIMAIALLSVIEGMLTADFALEAQHGLTEFGVGMVAVLSALGAGGLQIAAL